MAANSLGVSSASAYLKVVDTLETPTVPGHSSKVHPKLLYTVACSLGLLFLLAILIIWCTIKKLKKEKIKARTMECVNQWTKKVIIVQPPADNNNSGTTDSFVSFFFLNIISFLNI
jgi:hypothetical protein